MHRYEVYLVSSPGMESYWIWWVLCQRSNILDQGIRVQGHYGNHFPIPSFGSFYFLYLPLFTKSYTAVQIRLIQFHFVSHSDFWQLTEKADALASNEHITAYEPVLHQSVWSLFHMKWNTLGWIRLAWSHKAGNSQNWVQPWKTKPQGCQRQTHIPSRSCYLLPGLLIWGGGTAHKSSLGAISPGMGYNLAGRLNKLASRQESIDEDREGGLRWPASWPSLGARGRG